MPFIRYDQLNKEYVTPKYSKAFGELVTGESIEVGRLRFGKNEGAVEHSHSQEQIMYILSGRLRVKLGDETAELGPGEAFHAPPNVKHRVDAVEDTVVLSVKNVIKGVGHKI